MAKSINGRPGASIDSVLAKVSEPVPLVEVLEKSVGMIRWRKRGAEMQDRKLRKTTKGTSNEQRK